MFGGSMKTEGIGSKLNSDLMPCLRHGVVDPDLEHRKPSLQFDGPFLGSLLRVEFGLQATIDLDRKSGLRLSLSQTQSD
jgi:hypothetical protein